MRNICIYKGPAYPIQPLVAELKHRDIPCKIKTKKALRSVFDVSGSVLGGEIDFQGGAQSDYAGPPEDIRLLVPEEHAKTARQLMNELIGDSASLGR